MMRIQQGKETWQQIWVNADDQSDIAIDFQVWNQAWRQIQNLLHPPTTEIRRMLWATLNEAQIRDQSRL